MGKKKKILFELDAENQRLKMKLDETKRKLDEAGNRGYKAFKSRIKAGITAAVAALSTFIYALKESIGMLSSFDKSMRNVNSILNLSEQQFRSLKTEILGLQKETGLGAKELADGLYQAVSAGVQVQDAVAFMREAGKMSIAGIAEVTESVDILTTILNAFHLEADQAGRVTDVLFQTIKLGKTTLPELSASLAQVAPLAAANNIAFEEITAALATLTKQGVPTANAVTQIRSSIIGMNKALGDGWSDTMTYQEGVQAIADRAHGSQKALKDMIGRIEGVNAVLGLTGKNAKTAASDLKAMNESIGAANQAYLQQAKSIEVRWNKFIGGIKARLSEFMQTTVDLVAPVQTLTEKLKDEQAELNTLATSIMDAADNQKLRNDLIAELQKKYPDFLKNIKTEALRNTDIRDRLKEINEQYIKKIALAALNERKENAIKTAADKYLEEREALKAFNRYYFETMGQRADATASMEERLRQLMQMEGKLYGAGPSKAKAMYDDIRRSTNEYKEAQKEANDQLKDFNKLAKELNVTLDGTGGAGGGMARHTDQTEKFAKAVDAARMAIKGLGDEQLKTQDTIDTSLNHLAKNYNDSAEEMAMLSARIGQSMAEGFDTEGLKGALKNTLLVILEFLEREVIAAQVAAAVKSEFGDYSAYARIVALEALMQGARIAISSFASGTENFPGGLAYVHKDELISMPPGSNVHTKTETKQMLSQGDAETNRLLRELIDAVKDQRLVGKIKNYDLLIAVEAAQKNRMGNN